MSQLSTGLGKGEKAFCSRPALARIFGVCVKTIYRWQRDPKLDFPPPDLVINGREYWTDPTLDAWVIKHAQKPAA